jgi:hypothetical protein
MFSVVHVPLYKILALLRAFQRTGTTGLALFSIQQTDLTSFSADGRGVKWLCNKPKPYPYSNPNHNPNSNPNQINKKNQNETTLEN